MGGVRRVAEAGSIGVHRSSFSPDSGMSTDEAVANVQAVTADILAFMTEMGVDPKLLALALSYDESDVRYLSASEMAELGVTNASATQSGAGTSQLASPASPPETEASANEQELE